MTWYRSCHLHASRCMMACAKDGTQVAIGIHLKSTLLSFCPVFFFFFCSVLFVWLFLCVLLVFFVSFAFFVGFVLALGNWIALWTV